MPGDYLALKAELLKPDLVSLSSPAAAAKLATDTVTLLVPGSFLSERGILKVLGPAAGDAALGALEAAAAAGGVLARAVRILHDSSGPGLDFGDPATRDEVDALTAGGVLTAAAGAALKGVGQRTITRAEAIPGWELPASEPDVIHARSL
jgi:hypothetical protein